MTNEERIEALRDMSHEELARLYRFEPIGSPYFSNLDVELVFEEMFYDKFGGMTPEISKKIGWDGAVIDDDGNET